MKIVFQHAVSTVKPRSLNPTKGDNNQKSIIDLLHVLPETWIEVLELRQKEETFNTPETAKNDLKGSKHSTLT